MVQGICPLLLIANKLLNWNLAISLVCLISILKSEDFDPNPSNAHPVLMDCALLC